MSNETDDSEDAALKVPAEFAHLLAGMPTDFEVVNVELLEGGGKRDSFIHRYLAIQPNPNSTRFSNWTLCMVDSGKTGKIVAVSLKANNKGEIDTESLREVHVDHWARRVASVSSPGLYEEPMKLSEKPNPGPLISSCSSYENVQVEAGIGPEAVSAEPEADDISLDDDEVRAEIISHIVKGANEDVMASRTMIAELKADWPFELETNF